MAPRLEERTPRNGPARPLDNLCLTHGRCNAQGQDHTEEVNDRLRLSAFGEQALAGGVSRADLERLAAGWLAWAAAPDGWLSILHGEILARP